MPPGSAKIFFSDIQSITLNYHTPSLIVSTRIVLVLTKVGFSGIFRSVNDR